MKRDDSIMSEALAEALGQVVAELQKEWANDLEKMRLEFRAVVAELKLSAAGIASPATPAEPAAPAKPAKAGSIRT